MVKGRVDEVVAKGGRVLAGGEAVGPCYQATVITDVPADSEFAKHETFGPVLAVEIVDSADEAIARANATTYGLSAGILTSDADRGMALAQQLESGSSTSTSSRWATSRRCRSAASRTRAGAASAGRP